MTTSTSTSTAITTANHRDDYGRSNTLYYVNQNVPAANIVKVPRVSKWIVTNWFTSDKNDTRDFATRRDATAYARQICRETVEALNAETDADGYTFCDEGTCGACDNTGLACSNPVNPETGWVN